MKHDPFTLRIALDAAEHASGDLYLDDGDSYQYQSGELVWRKFTARKHGKTSLQIQSEDLVLINGGKNAVDGAVVSTGTNAFKTSIADVRVEKIVVYGLKSKPGKVVMSTGQEVEWEYTPGAAAKGSDEAVASSLVIRDPAVKVVDDWNIEVIL